MPKVPAKAPLFITADQSYRLYVNGTFVARGPARGFQAEWPYDEIDIRAHLVKGRNVLAIRAYNPGFSNFQYLTEGYAGLLVAAQWGKVRIASNPEWKSLRQESVSQDTVPVSIQIFKQEHIDLRKETGDWTAPDFDDSEWISPKPRVWNSAPWFTLSPRGTPMLTERELAPLALLGANEGTSAPGYEQTRNVVALRFREDRSHRRATQGFSPLIISAAGKGQFRSYLFDFGKTVVGNLSLNVTGAQGGEILDTSYYETIDAATLTPDWTPDAGCHMAFGDRVILRPGTVSHTFHHHNGFRYLLLTARDVKTYLSLRLNLNWVGYPLDRKGSFLSSDTDLNRIWETCAWTQQCCSLDAYVDTPWREQAQWWGDARVQAWNTFHLNGDTRLFRRGILQISRQTTPDGVTYGHAPTMAHNCVLPDFTLIWFLTLWDYYWQTGSTEPLLAHHEVIQKALDYFRAHTDPRSGLITYDDRFWLFLDWTGIFKDGAPTVYNLWLLIALEKLALLYRKAKQPKSAVPLEVWAKKLRGSITKLLDKNGLLRDGIDRKGRIVSSTCIHSQTLGIIANIKGLHVDAALERLLLPYIRNEVKFDVTPSAYWVTYVFSVLTNLGHGAEVVAFIKKQWLTMADHGTTWENFAPHVADESFSHAWSAHPLYHLMQTVGGITQTAPEWKEIVFRPTFHDSDGATTIPTPHGLIRSEWKKASGTVKVKLQLPAGVKAHVELPGLPAKTITGRGAWSVKI